MGTSGSGSRQPKASLGCWLNSSPLPGLFYPLRERIIGPDKVDAVTSSSAPGTLELVHVCLE